MPITFHTKSYADLTFISDVGTQLIEIMGHTATVPGAILANDLPAALAHLRSSAAAPSASDQAVQDLPSEDKEQAVSVAHRALPLIQLLEAAIADKQNVMWD